MNEKGDDGELVFFFRESIGVCYMRGSFSNALM
jgi:hypothetical protein